MLEKINDFTHRINGQSYYNEKVGIYLIELENLMVLVDIPKYTDKQRKEIMNFGKPIICILTHGASGIEDGKLWQKHADVKIYCNVLDKHSKWLKLIPDIYYEIIPFISEHLKIINTPGHTEGSICIYDVRTKTLFSGDTIYGNENRNIRFKQNGSVENYAKLITSYKYISTFDIRNIYPFHYKPIINFENSKLIGYINNLQTN